VEAIVNATESCDDEVTVVELMVIPAPNAALAPVWKLAPVTVTVRLAPGAPDPGVTPVIVSCGGTVALAAAVVPSAKLAVTVKLAPVPNRVGF
jgi:hypothetical protein